MDGAAPSLKGNSRFGFPRNGTTNGTANGTSHHALEKLFGFLRVAAGLQDLCQLALAIPAVAFLGLKSRKQMMKNLWKSWLWQAMENGF